MKKTFDNAIHKLVEDIASNDIEPALNSDDVKRIDANGKNSPNRF
jgi:hypothetical protein